MKTFTLILKSHTDTEDIEMETRADKFVEAQAYFYDALDGEFSLEEIAQGMEEN